MEDITTSLDDLIESVAPQTSINLDDAINEAAPSTPVAGSMEALEAQQQAAETKKKAVDPLSNFNKLSADTQEKIDAVITQLLADNPDLDTYTAVGALTERLKEHRKDLKAQKDKEDALAKAKAKEEAAARGAENAKSLGDGVGKFVIAKTGTYFGANIIEKKGAKTYTVRCTPAWKNSHALKRDAKYIKPENMVAVFDTLEEIQAYILENNLLENKNFDVNVSMEGATLPADNTPADTAADSQ